MDEFVSWLADQLLGRINGPLKFRLILQPVLAVLFAVRDGLKDVRRGSAPYFCAIFTDSSRRLDLILEEWKAIAGVFLFAAVMDLIYQYLVLSRLYPGAALSIALLLAFVPYLLVRGPVTRLSRRLKERRLDNQTRQAELLRGASQRRGASQPLDSSAQSVDMGDRFRSPLGRA